MELHLCIFCKIFIGKEGIEFHKQTQYHKDNVQKTEPAFSCWKNNDYVFDLNCTTPPIYSCAVCQSQFSSYAAAHHHLTFHDPSQSQLKQVWSQDLKFKTEFGYKDTLEESSSVFKGDNMKVKNTNDLNLSSNSMLLNQNNQLELKLTIPYEALINKMPIELSNISTPRNCSPKSTHNIQNFGNNPTNISGKPKNDMYNSSQSLNQSFIRNEERSKINNIRKTPKNLCYSPFEHLSQASFSNIPQRFSNNNLNVYHIEKSLPSCLNCHYENKLSNHCQIKPQNYHHKNRNINYRENNSSCSYHNQCQNFLPQTFDETTHNHLNNNQNYENCRNNSCCNLLQNLFTNHCQNSQQLSYNNEGNFNFKNFGTHLSNLAENPHIDISSQFCTNNQHHYTNNEKVNSNINERISRNSVPNFYQNVISDQFRSNKNSNIDQINSQLDQNNFQNIYTESNQKITLNYDDNKPSPFKRFAPNSIESNFQPSYQNNTQNLLKDNKEENINTDQIYFSKSPSKTSQDTLAKSFQSNDQTSIIDIKKSDANNTENFLKITNQTPQQDIITQTFQKSINKLSNMVISDISNTVKPSSETSNNPFTNFPNINATNINQNIAQVENDPTNAKENVFPNPFSNTLPNNSQNLKNNAENSYLKIPTLNLKNTITNFNTNAISTKNISEKVSTDKNKNMIFNIVYEPLQKNISNSEEKQNLQNTQKPESVCTYPVKEIAERSDNNSNFDSEDKSIKKPIVKALRGLKTKSNQNNFKNTPENSLNESEITQLFQNYCVKNIEGYTVSETENNENSALNNPQSPSKIICDQVNSEQNCQNNSQHPAQLISHVSEEIKSDGSCLNNLLTITKILTEEPENNNEKSLSNNLKDCAKKEKYEPHTIKKVILNNSDNIAKTDLVNNQKPSLNDFKNFEKVQNLNLHQCKNEVNFLNDYKMSGDFKTHESEPAKSETNKQKITMKFRLKDNDITPKIVEDKLNGTNSVCQDMPVNTAVLNKSENSSQINEDNITRLSFIQTISSIANDDLQDDSSIAFKYNEKYFPNTAHNSEKSIRKPIIFVPSDSNEINNRDGVRLENYEKPKTYRKSNKLYIPGFKNTQKYYCDICDIPLDSEHNYYHHLMGKKHFVKFQNSPMRPTITYAPNGVDAVISNDSTTVKKDKKYYCSVCKFHLWYEPNYNIHIESAKHIAAVALQKAISHENLPEAKTKKNKNGVNHRNMRK